MAGSKKREKRGINVLEQGDVYFMYRPRVSQGATEVHGLEEVQRLYMIMSPRGPGLYRLIVMPKKQLPAARSGGEKFWGFVDKVGSTPEAVTDELDRKTYQTRTGGERVQPEARPAGEGVYSLVQHGDHTHLAYALELPAQPGDVQQALNIQGEASYIISVKNPDQPAPKGVGLEEPRQAEFPRKLQKRFRERRFAPVDPPGFLDYQGTEILFIGTAQDPSEDLGIALEAEDESESTADIFNDLRLEKSQHPTAPLFQGRWS